MTTQQFLFFVLTVALCVVGSMLFVALNLGAVAFIALVGLWALIGLYVYMNTEAV